MAASRSALEFMQRHKIVEATSQPAPRLAVHDLLVHFLPTSSPPKPLANTLCGYEGEPPPDRGAARPWPRQE